jgi:hypothetical protein
LSVVRAAKTLGLVGLIASGNRTNTFHAGSAPLGGLKGVYHQSMCKSNSRRNRPIHAT